MPAEKGLKGLESILGLQLNWDSYGGRTITPEAVETAKKLILNPPWITPCSDGGIQLEWHEEGEVHFEIFIGPDGKQSLD